MTIYDFRVRSDAAILFNEEPSATKQSFRDSCNINNILRKYTKNENNPFSITSDAKFGDFSNVPSYQEALDLVISADEHFMRFPADVRARFSNNPAEFLEFLSDEKNRDEARSLGLLATPVPETEISLSKASMDGLTALFNAKS